MYILDTMAIDSVLAKPVGVTQGPPANSILAENGDNLVTESGDPIVTEV